MATNVIQTSSPPLWNSSNDDMVFGFSFKSNAVISIINSSGRILVTIAGIFDLPPAVGGTVALRQTLQYDGDWTVLSINTYASPYITTIELDTTYTVSIGSVGYIYNLRVPTFTFGKGYKVLELYAAELPYEVLVTGYLPTIKKTTGNLFEIDFEINVLSVIKSMFVPQPYYVNTMDDNIDFNSFNAFRLTFDNVDTYFFNTYGFTSSFNLIFNTMLSTNTLNEEYIDLGKYFTPIDKPLISSNGYSFATKFVNKYPTIHRFLNGVKI